MTEKIWARNKTRSAFKALSDSELERLCDTIDNLEPRFLSFEALRKISDEILGPSETERLLYNGLNQEMKRRGYV